VHQEGAGRPNRNTVVGPSRQRRRLIPTCSIVHVSYPRPVADMHMFVESFRRVRHGWPDELGDVDTNGSATPQLGIQRWCRAHHLSENFTRA